MLDLFWTTLLTGLLLLALGTAFLLDRPGWRKAARGFLRSEAAAVVTMGLGGLWFLYKMWFLGPQDALFGPMTNLVFVAIFGAGWIGSFFVLKDFLAVRGACVLILMAAFFALKAGWMHYEAGALFLKAVVYALIVLAIWWGVSPFRARDFLNWLERASIRPRAVGGTLATLGLLLGLTALTF